MPTDSNLSDLEDLVGCANLGEGGGQRPGPRRLAKMPMTAVSLPPEANGYIYIYKGYMLYEYVIIYVRVTQTSASIYRKPVYTYIYN